MDFNAFVRDARKEGLSGEDIARGLNEAMNQVEAEDKKDSRSETLKRKQMLFASHYKASQINLRDVARLAVLVVANSYLNWTVDDIEEYQDAVEENLRTLAEMQGKNLGDMLEQVISSILPEKPKTCGKECQNKPKNIDDDRIKRFLNSL